MLEFTMIFIMILAILLKGQPCPLGQYENKDSSCLVCPFECLSCAGLLFQGYPCTECLRNLCQVCTISNCLRCYTNSAANCQCQCTECMKSFALDNGSCIEQCDNSCSICLSGQQCLCKFGMFKKNNQCFHCNDYCLNCYWSYLTYQNECSKCQDYFYTDKYGNCLPCNSGCKNCVQNDNDLSLYCLNCDAGKYSLNGQCQECSIKGCTNCIYDGTEVKCLTQISQNCQKENIPNCKQCDPMTSQNKCLYCDEGYYENQGLCEICKSPCRTCQSKTQCLSCSDGYLDLEQNCKTCTHPCKTCKGPTETDCITCISGYFSSSNTCYTYQNKFWVLLFISILSIYIFQLIRQLCKYTQQRYTQIRIDN